MNLMIFEQLAQGHALSYMQALCHYWRQHQYENHELYFVLSNAFVSQYSEFVDEVQSDKRTNAKVIPISASDERDIGHRPPGFLRNIKTCQVMNKYARQLHIDHVFFVEMDEALNWLSMGGETACSLSGIYFKPTFHYSSMGSYSSSVRAKMQMKLEAGQLSRVLHRGRLKKLFCHDPFAVDYITHNLKNGGKSIFLPEPMYVETSSASVVTALRETLGIEDGKKIFLMFGHFHSGKGVLQVLDAILTLPRTTTERMCLLLVGQIPSARLTNALGARLPQISLIQKPYEFLASHFVTSNVFMERKFKERITRVQQSTACQVVWVNGFVDDKDVGTYFHLADIVLIPYQRHIGSSGILVLAAAAGKPVLSQDYGLLGEFTRQHKLGSTIDSTSSQEIACGLKCFIENPSQIEFDAQQAQAYAEMRSPDKFAGTILENLLAV